MAGIQILDSKLTDFGLLDSSRSKHPGLFCKSDIEKACNHVNQNCFDLSVGKTCFRREMEEMVLVYISTVFLSILVNDNQTVFPL